MSWALVKREFGVTNCESIVPLVQIKSTYLHVRWISSPALSFYVLFILPHHYHVFLIHRFLRLLLQFSWTIFMNVHFLHNQQHLSSFIFFLTSISLFVIIVSNVQFRFCWSVQSVRRLCTTGVNKASTATEGPALFRCIRLASPKRSKDCLESLDLKQSNKVTKCD